MATSHFPALRISHFAPPATSRSSRCSREASAAPVVVEGSTSSSQSKRWCKQELLIRRSARLSKRRTRPQQVSKVDERLLLRVSIITFDLLAAAASSGAGRGAHWQLLQACPYGLFAFPVWTNESRRGRACSATATHGSSGILVAESTTRATYGQVAVHPGQPSEPHASHE